jgi:hypothetical protein
MLILKLSDQPQHCMTLRELLNIHIVFTSAPGSPDLSPLYISHYKSDVKLVREITLNIWSSKPLPLS